MIKDLFLYIDFSNGVNPGYVYRANYTESLGESENS